ncbi:flagellar biosynthesis anti-sigma factor FlgM [Shewanella corallii]|uniref:Negative regulator of flagellin synthesis n=1 Tax=Shewanella corallii TaxID=560080 RepID=A0ABT0NB39_9GAMM|nr:flagellar biosynthesis anti-sigma factor FlgM [Shewanella corallii]MCL2915052.1 flagellar biosynthesis anti-sigma factor FlgM [Shewanella corallii]
MEIRKTSTPQVTLVNSQKSAAPQQAKAEVKTAGNEPAVSQDWRLLEQGHEELKSTSDFDADKVAALRQSLKDGSFDLDVGLIAGAMLRQHG